MNIRDLDEVNIWFVQKGVLRRVLLSSENLMLVYYEIEPSCILPMHSHPHEQMGFMIQGEGEFSVNGKKIHVGKGSAYFIKPNEPHEFRALGNEKCIVLDIFYPPRMDFAYST